MSADKLREAALSLLNLAGKPGIRSCSRKAGSFLGQCAFDPQPLSEAQAEWLDTLLINNGFQPLDGGDQ